MEYRDVWILAEHEQGELKLVSFELLKRGRALADKRDCQLVAVLLGRDFQDGELQRLFRYGADKVIVAKDPVFEHFLPEPYCSALRFLVRKHQPEILIASATTTGRTVAPAVAVQCHTGLTADCTELDIEESTGNLIQTRPSIGGNILATIKTPDRRPQMATVRPHSNKPLAPDEKKTGEILYEEIPGEFLQSRIRRVEFRLNSEEGGNIQDAEIIVAGGKGFKKDENFKMLHKLAALLSGTVGATRDAVDLGWAGYPQQIGLSGKTVSPKFYLAAGISGSVQHLAGIKTAENIAAINNDPDAQIFQVADYGIAADIFEVLPILNEKLNAYRQTQARPEEK